MARYATDPPMPPVEEVLRCGFEPCSLVWRRLSRPGPTPEFCSDRCKQADYRARLRLPNKQARAAHVAARQCRRRKWEHFEREEWLRFERDFHDQSGRFFNEPPWGSAGMSVGEARAAIFKLADTADDGSVSVVRAYRRALKRSHTDTAGVSTEEAKKLLAELQKARQILEDAGAWP
ncbi:J domain-containing protein [Actinomadura violacea]|uniref:J domain-containing protein n=1 Tax=Actinomadura violacea TaxID=2819934 RepID=A0ABS3S7R6_9ACTN|nr:J domain-containing protein [Actinomadura violacea]MBO2464931.1 J domain-containing protein [Actinomadura violacea]